MQTQALKSIISQDLESHGFQVNDSSPEFTDSSIDIVATHGNSKIYLSIKSPTQNYLSFNAIAQAQYDATKNTGVKVVPIIVGYFAVSANTSAIAENNGVRIINIPRNLSTDERISGFVSHELHNILAEVE